MTGTGNAITNTPLSEQRPPTHLPIIVRGTMSPYLKYTHKTEHKLIVSLHQLLIRTIPSCKKQYELVTTCIPTTQKFIQKQRAHIKTYFV